MFSHGVDEDAPLANVCRERLLSIHIEAGLHGVNAGQRASMIRRGDEHGVEPFPVNHLAIVLIYGPARLPLFGGIDGSLKVTIGEGNDPTGLRNLIDKLPGAAADADHPNENLFVSSGRILETQHACWYEHRSGNDSTGRGGAFQEFAA